MISLNLKFHASNQDVWFETTEAATAALEGLKARLAEPYGRNSEAVHTIIAPAGPVVVVCAKIEAASIIDVAKADAITERLLERQIEREARMAAAIRRAEKSA